MFRQWQRWKRMRPNAPQICLSLRPVPKNERKEKNTKRQQNFEGSGPLSAHVQFLENRLKKEKVDDFGL